MRVEMKPAEPKIHRAKLLRTFGLTPPLTERLDSLRHPSTTEAPEDEQQAATLTVREGNKMFTVYRVQIKCADQHWTVHKRYSEFDDLDKAVSF